jgi:hypothetical protein
VPSRRKKRKTRDVFSFDEDQSTQQRGVICFSLDKSIKQRVFVLFPEKESGNARL